MNRCSSNIYQCIYHDVNFFNIIELFSCNVYSINETDDLFIAGLWEGLCFPIPMIVILRALSQKLSDEGRWETL